MNNQALLNDIVCLYRMADKISGDEDHASCELIANNDAVLCINQIEEQNEDIVKHLKCDGVSIHLPLKDNICGSKLQFTLNFPVILHRLFFKNIEHLISHHTGVKKGKIPDSLYLIEEDFLSGEDNEPEKYQQLKQVCRWIEFLKEALSHTEERNDSYIFVLLTEDKENKGFKKYLIESRFEYSDLCRLNGLDKFEAILTNDDLHSSERLAVVRNALEELFANHPAEKQKLGFTLSKFEILKQLYQDNYETYINGFSLRDFKKEVIEKYNEVASLIESNLNDIVNKAFIIPVSIASVGALIKVNELISGVIVSFGVFLVSIFMWRLTNQHLNRLKSIDDVLNETFECFRDRKESAAQFVNEKREHLVERAVSIRSDLKLLRLLSITPLLSAIILLFFKYPEINSNLKLLISSIFCFKLR